jgi:AAA lid domain-containing protein
MARALGYRFSPEAHQVLRRYLNRRVGQPGFANARSVRNAVDSVRPSCPSQGGHQPILRKRHGRADRSAGLSSFPNGTGRVTQTMV